MPPRRLRPGQDIYRVEKGREGWLILRYSHRLGAGFHVSEHDTRDQARAAKKEHEQRYDQALKRKLDRFFEKGTD